MQIDEIKDLMEKMSQTGLTVLEFENDGSRLRLERTPAPVYVNADCTAPVAAAAPYAAAPAGTSQAPSPAGAAAAEPADRGGHLVLSPVVGIYYAAASPDSDPFVKVGSPVEVGTPLCIIEAMKLMNEVTSTVEGLISEIMVENGQRVEYGQPLMRIGGNTAC